MNAYFPLLLIIMSSLAAPQAEKTDSKVVNFVTEFRNRISKVVEPTNPDKQDAAQSLPEGNHSMLELFAFGTILFWCIVAAEVLLLITYTEQEKGVAATVSFLTFLAALQWLSGVDLINYLWTNPLHLGIAVVAYVLLGLMWASFRWVGLIRDRLHRHDALLADFCQQNSLPRNTQVLPEEYRKKWKEIVVKHKEEGTNWLNYETIASVPMISNHKKKIIHWFCLWPTSLLIYCCRDLFKNLFNKVYHLTASAFQRVADNIWPSRIDENLEIPKEN